MAAIETDKRTAELREYLERIRLDNKVAWVYTIVATGGLRRDQLETIGEVLSEHNNKPLTLRSLFEKAKEKNDNFPSLPKDKFFDYVGVTYELPVPSLEMPQPEGKTGIIAAFTLADILGGEMRPLTGDFYRLAGLIGYIEIKYDTDPLTGRPREVFLPTNSAVANHKTLHLLFDSRVLSMLQRANHMIITDQWGMTTRPLP